MSSPPFAVAVILAFLFGVLLGASLMFYFYARQIGLRLALPWKRATTVEQAREVAASFVALISNGKVNLHRIFCTGPPHLVAGVPRRSIEPPS